MVLKNIPKSFNSKFEIVSCFCELDKKILLLHRQDHKAQGNTWGVPAGKIENGENLDEAIIREIKEETGIDVPQADLSYYKKIYVRYSDYDFIYHIFRAKLNNGERIVINEQEHKDFRWILPSDALEMKLIEDLDECIKMFYCTIISI